jgi:hypothetical protein
VGTTTFILNVGNQRRIGEQQASRSEFVKYRCQTTGRGPFGELQHCFCFLQNFLATESPASETTLHYHKKWGSLDMSRYWHSSHEVVT